MDTVISAERGGPLQAVLQLLFASILYERFVRRRGPFVETPWVVVYVFAAPLLFGGSSLPPLLGLFCTRFVIEALSGAGEHWAVAVSTLGSDRRSGVIAAAELYQPLLPD